MRKEDPKAFILGIAERIRTQTRRSEHQMTNSSVTLRKRVRNWVDSDRYGVFNNGSGGSDVWIDDFDTSALYSLNITTPTIRTNASAMVTAAVEIDVQPRVLKDSLNQMAAAVGRAILEQKERLQWTSFLEEQIAIEQQVGPGTFVRTRFNPSLKRMHSLPKWEDVEVELPGQATCTQCGNQSPSKGAVGDTASCGVCGGMAMITEAHTTAAVPVPTGHAQFSVGDTDTTVIPFFEVRIDDQNTQGGNLEAAKWMEHHYLESLDDLQLAYPNSAEEIQGQTFIWPYALRWQQTLKRNRRVPQDFNSESVIDLREVRDIYLTPGMYLNVELQDDLILKDAKGKVRFSVKQGQTYGDAIFEGEPFDDAPVLCFRIVGNALIDVYPNDFRPEWAYVTFLKNSSNFWGLYLSDLTILQDMINTVLTIQMFHIRRNAITSIVYNRNAFDPEAFEEDLIPTREGIPPEVPIGATFGVVPALQLSGEPMQMMNTVIETSQLITLTTPAMMGQAQPGEPYRAQLLQKQSSLGLLAPASISKASAKVKWAKMQLWAAQTYGCEEDFELLLKLNPEWDSGYIDAFLKADIDTDLIVDYTEGSEVPTSLIEREVKLAKLWSDVLQLAQLAPGLIKPEMITEILSESIEMAGLDIDVNNTQENMRLAEARYDKLLSFVNSIPVKTNNPQINAMVAKQITTLPDLQPLMRENFAIISEFYGDRAVAEGSKDAPNYLLLACLDNLVQMEEAGTAREQQQQQQLQLAAQAPAMQQAQQQAQQQQMVQMQAEQAQVQQKHQNQMQLETLKQAATGQRIQAEQDNKAVLAAHLQNQQQGHEQAMAILQGAQDQQMQQAQQQAQQQGAENGGN